MIKVTMDCMHVPETCNNVHHGGMGFHCSERTATFLDHRVLADKLTQWYEDCPCWAYRIKAIKPATECEFTE